MLRGHEANDQVIVTPPKHTQIQGSVSTLAVKPWTQCLKGGLPAQPQEEQLGSQGSGLRKSLGVREGAEATS